MNDTAKKNIFARLKTLLAQHRKGLDARTTIIGSRAREKKPSYHLYGRKSISVAGRKPQPTYVAGVIMQKNFVSLYCMPVYSHPGLVFPRTAELRKSLKGKSCFHLTRLTSGMYADLHHVLKAGIALYRRKGWI